MLMCSHNLEDALPQHGERVAQHGGCFARIHQVFAQFTGLFAHLRIILNNQLLRSNEYYQHVFLNLFFTDRFLKNIII